MMFWADLFVVLGLIPDLVLSTQAFLIIGKICCTIGPESTVRLYFWRPPRTLSRRTPTQYRKKEHYKFIPFRDNTF